MNVSPCPSPQEPIARVQEQNQRLETRINMLTRTMDTLQQQNSQLLQICSALADSSGIRLDADEDTRHSKTPPP